VCWTPSWRRTQVWPRWWSPTVLGATFANLLCGDLPLGDTFTYLSVEGPAWIGAHLQVDPPPQDWAVGGLSYGGTCSCSWRSTHPRCTRRFWTSPDKTNPPSAIGQHRERNIRRQRDRVCAGKPLGRVEGPTFPRYCMCYQRRPRRRRVRPAGPSGRRCQHSGGNEHPPAARWAHLGGVGRGTQTLGTVFPTSRGGLTL